MIENLAGVSLLNPEMIVSAGLLLIYQVVAFSFEIFYRNFCRLDSRRRPLKSINCAMDIEGVGLL
jgi:hypothetical protein